MTNNVAAIAAAVVFATEIEHQQDEELLVLSLVEEKKKKKRKHSVWVREWITERENRECNTSFKFQQRLLECDLKEFRKMLRMPPEVFEMILQGVRPYIEKLDTNYRKAISAEERLSMTLKYFATGEPITSLSESYRVGYCTVSNVIKETSVAIYKAFKNYIKFPTNASEWERVVSAFDQRWNYPGCLGALDGKHIRIMKPWKTGSLYYNYKKFFSIVLMAIVDSNYEFLYVNVGAEGQVADGGLWRECDVYKALSRDEIDLPDDIVLRGTRKRVHCHFIADDAFAMGPRMMKPFAQRLRTDRDEIFNYRLSRARRIVENAFGICASRFRVLRGEICMNPDSAQNMVLAICVLHNILRKHCGRSYMPHTSVDHEDNSFVIHPGSWRFDKDGGPLPDVEPDVSRNPTKIAKDMRETLADYMSSPQGSVPWQGKHLHNKLDRLLENINTLPE